MKKINIILGIAIISIALPTSVVFAQSSPIQKVLENVKDTVDNLVTAKDQNSTQELGFRIQTFKKVLDYVTTEAQDTRVKLFLVEDFSNKDLIKWRNEKVATLANAIKYYESEKKLVETKENSMTIDDIKNIAKDFKEVRDTKYVLATDEAKEFLLITQEKTSVEVAKSRTGKIATDIKNINSNKLNSLLDSASKLVKDAEKLNSQANDLFWNKYINPPKTQIQKEASSTISTTEDVSTSTIATSTEITMTENDSNEAGSEEPTQPSIKDLIKTSLSNIKDAYQIFIEMSSLVRKGL